MDVAPCDQVGARRQRQDLRDPQRDHRQQSHRDEHLDEAESPLLELNFARIVHRRCLRLAFREIVTVQRAAIVVGTPLTTSSPCHRD